MDESLTGGYQHDGFLFRPELLCAAEAQVLRDETDRLLAGELPPDRFIVEKDGRTVRTIANPHLFSDVFARLVRHPVLLDVAQCLLQDDVYVFQTTSQRPE